MIAQKWCFGCRDYRDHVLHGQCGTCAEAGTRRCGQCGAHLSADACETCTRLRDRR